MAAAAVHWCATTIVGGTGKPRCLTGNNLDHHRWLPFTPFSIIDANESLRRGVQAVARQVDAAHRPYLSKITNVSVGQGFQQDTSATALLLFAAVPAAGAPQFLLQQAKAGKKWSCSHLQLHFSSACWLCFVSCRNAFGRIVQSAFFNCLSRGVTESDTKPLDTHVSRLHAADCQNANLDATCCSL